MSAFAEGAARLAGFAGTALGWSPDAFWRATPAELAAVAGAFAAHDGGDGRGGGIAPPDADLIARLQEAHPDG